MNNLSNNSVIALSGGFDPLTDGHVSMIQDAKSLGTVTIILNSDRWIHDKYSYQPRYTYDIRREMLLSIPGVDTVIRADDKDGSVSKTLLELRPEYFGNGFTKKLENIPESETCRELGIGLVFFLGKFVTPLISDIRNRAIQLAEALKNKEEMED